MEVRNELFTQKYTKVCCEDKWNYNAPHHFEVLRSDDESDIQHIDFQEGPIKEVGLNGIMNEDLLLMVLVRLEAFQQTEYCCDENQEAIDAIKDAIFALRARTNDREARGVEGTHNI